MVTSVTYCEECEEYLCPDCTHSHRNRKATKAHNPIAVEKIDSKVGSAPLCEPCDETGSKEKSFMYCKECEEHLCEMCTKSHMNRKATKSHQLIPASEIKEKEEDRKFCDPCQMINIKKDAKSFCVECEELLCADCTNQHRTKKITKSHTLESPACVQYAIRECDVCDTKDEIATMFCKTCEEAFCETCGLRHKKQNATKSHAIDQINGRTLVKIIKCDICTTDAIKAETYCVECDENFCGDCTRVHKKQKKTAEHELISPAPAREREQAQTKEVVICEACNKSKHASKYCIQCESHLCEDCCQIHRRSKFSKSHVLQESEEVEAPNCDSCKTPGSATSYCKQCDEFFCKICNMQHQKVEEAREHQVMSVPDGLQSRKEQSIAETMQFRYFAYIDFSYSKDTKYAVNSYFFNSKDSAKLMM